MPEKHRYELKLDDTTSKAKPKSNRGCLIFGVIFLGVSVIVLIVGIVLLHQKSKAPCALKQTGEVSSCTFSDEARRVKLPELLEKIKEAFFELAPNNVAWKPDLVGYEQRAAYVNERYAPYDPSPNALKTTADRARSLLNELKSTTVNQDLLKPRESKAFAQAAHFLEHIFGVPYDGNYYAGDWMLGPNYFCWQPLCNVGYDLNAYGSHAAPRTYNDIIQVINTIKSHRNIFTKYRQNMERGVRSGMVRSITDCTAGTHAFKNRFKGLAAKNRSSAVFNEFYAKNFLSSNFLANLQSGVAEQWKKDKKQNVTETIKAALIDGFAQPLLGFVAFLELEHRRHCPPDSVTSGLSELPLKYVWVDGLPDKTRPTNRTLPTGEPLDGKQTYRSILSYFTTSDITPEEIYAEGLKQLDIFMPQVISIAKELTGKPNDTQSAIKAFQQRLDARDQWHNSKPFPANESDENAYNTCVNPASAKLHCPKRWEAVQKWAGFIMQVMAMIDPKLYSVFYYTGPKATAANCPIEMQPHYNPANGAMYFDPSDSKCSHPGYFGLPFFLKEYGPKFQEWSVIGHEARPGHHTQLQGLNEHFRDTCGGVPSWLDKQTSYIVFSEGWALYGENPILSHDVDLYESNKLQKYGMLKWQVWRAVRLVVDTGLHYRGMKRSEALEHFANYTWDTTDFAVKEVTRYQSDPGQATAYMLGRLEIIKLRLKVEKELGSSFDIREFHYQVLSQGSAPVTYLRAHIDRYIRCAKGKLRGEICDIILKKSAGKKDGAQSQGVETEEQLPTLPPQRHFI